MFNKAPGSAAVPRKVTVDVSQDLHEVRVDRGQTHTGSFPHVNGALLRQVHVVKVDELELGLLLRPRATIWETHKQDRINQNS